MVILGESNIKDWIIFGEISMGERYRILTKDPLENIK